MGWTKWELQDLILCISGQNVLNLQKKNIWNETALSLNQIICKSALALDEDQWPKLFLLKKKQDDEDNVSDEKGNSPQWVTFHPIV